MTRADEDGRRRKTGGRRKGTSNKSTALVREAILAVFSDLQDGGGGENGHLLQWAGANPTDFYKLAAKLLPLQVTGDNGGPVVSRIELVAPGIDGAVALPPPSRSGE
jgi:hypothetical protein